MIYKILVTAAMLLVLSGCSSTAPTTPPASSANQAPLVVTSLPLSSTPAPSTASSPVATPSGSASISGQAVSTGADRQPIRETVIFLAQVYPDANTGEEVFALDLANSPASFTDDNGNFRFTDIAPGRYVISLGDFYGVKDIVREPSGTAKVYTLENDKLVDAGVVQVRSDVSPGR